MVINLVLYLCMHTHYHIQTCTYIDVYRNWRSLVNANIPQSWTVYTAVSVSMILKVLEGPRSAAATVVLPFLYHQLISSFFLGKDPFTLWSFVTVCYWKWHYLSSLIYLVIIHSYLSFTMFYLLIRLVWWWFSIIVQFANCHQPRPEAPQLATAADERPRLREPERRGRVPGAARVPWRNAMAPPGCT